MARIGHKTIILSFSFLFSLLTFGLMLYFYITISKDIALLKDNVLDLQAQQSRDQANVTYLLSNQEGAVKEAQNAADAVTNKLGALQDSISKDKALAKNTVISASDIAPYVDGVPQILCLNQNGNVSSGSGSLWKLKDISYAVLTNKHVVSDASKCVVSISNKDSQTLGVYSLDTNIFTYNKNTDSAIIAIGQAVSKNATAVSSFNYSLSGLRKCPSSIAIASPMVIIGFPAYAKRDTETNIDTIGNVKTIYRTVTNGIVSGYDSSQSSTNGPLSDPNYFISAKIDSGNSGGIALAKDSNGLCVLGIPTWLTIGNYETQGLLQNIRNVMP